jgi:hypothetical protein
MLILNLQGFKSFFEKVFKIDLNFLTILFLKSING